MKQRNSLRLLSTCIIVSLLLHLFIAYSFNRPNVEPPPENSQRKEQTKSDEEDNKTSIWVSPGIVPCDSYDGIGVQFNQITGIVSHVAPDSPAYKAGVKNGDELVTPLWNMQLIFAQKINLVVIRDGKHITLPVVVDRICHE
jgi:S1-C subfamily serine protease